METILMHIIAWILLFFLTTIMAIYDIYVNKLKLTDLILPIFDTWLIVIVIFEFVYWTNILIK